MTDLLDVVEDVIELFFLLTLALIFFKGTEPIPWLGVVWLVVAALQVVQMVMSR